MSPACPELGTSVHLRMRTHRDHQPEHVRVRTIYDGEPFTYQALVEGRSGVDVWWGVDIPMRNPVTRYRWFLAGGAYDYAWLTAAGTIEHDVADATDFVLTVHGSLPEWLPEAVVYQVFPDRFARSSARDQEGPANAPAGVDLPDWTVPRAWRDHPDGRSRQTAHEYFGGDLDGVREHLDHIEGMGANTLYLTPFFPAGSTHRYDAVSFAHVDDLLGGDAALARLVEEAHRRGMRVIGDITLNHCGVGHEWFARAVQDPDSDERGYFRFDSDARHGYECWWDHPSLPKFDHTSQSLRRRLITDDDAPVRTWLRGEGGLDGWRVDVANMAGRMGSVNVTHEVMRDVRSAMAEEGDDLVLLAEHAHDASDDLLGDGWHGTMNYAGFTHPVMLWLRGPKFTETYLNLGIAMPRFTGMQMVASIGAFQARMTWSALIASWNILSSHDSARIRSVVGSPARQSAALAMVIGLPGVPMVFAGDEIGAEGLWGEDARTPFPWGRTDVWDAVTLDDYRTLLGLRATSAALASGGLRWLHVGADEVAFLRESEQESVVVVVARDQCEPVRLNLVDIGATGVERLYGFEARVEAGHMVIEIPSAGAGIWRLEGM